MSRWYKQSCYSKHRPCDSLYWIKLLLINWCFNLSSIYLSIYLPSIYLSILLSSLLRCWPLNPWPYMCWTSTLLLSYGPSPETNKVYIGIFFSAPPWFRLYVPGCQLPGWQLHFTLTLQLERNISKDRLDHIYISFYWFGEWVQKAFHSLGLLTPAASPHFLPQSLTKQ